MLAFQNKQIYFYYEYNQKFVFKLELILGNLGLLYLISIFFSFVHGKTLETPNTFCHGTQFQNWFHYIVSMYKPIEKKITWISQINFSGFVGCHSQ